MLFRPHHLPILLAFAATVATAGTVAVPATPESPHSDTESVTNAAVRASLIRKTRTFSGTISLNATASNTLEVAFGTSRNGDGILLPGDETFSLGWENGAWFIDTPTNRIAATVQEGDSRRSLSFSVRVSADGVPTRFSISDDAFASLTNAPPTWLFSSDWDAVRVTSGGLDASPGCLSFGTKRHPYLGDSLPNGTPAESLVVLRTPLGIVPEANWRLLEGTGVVSRFWHDTLPDGGRVFTWENALLDRLSDRPATIQVELRTNGDFVYRYHQGQSTTLTPQVSVLQTLAANHLESCTS
jgi:hypothetical protein